MVDLRRIYDYYTSIRKEETDKYPEMYMCYDMDDEVLIFYIKTKSHYLDEFAKLHRIGCVETYDNMLLLSPEWFDECFSVNIDYDINNVPPDKIINFILSFALDECSKKIDDFLELRDKINNALFHETYEESLSKIMDRLNSVEGG